ncbi:MAG: hypothetical protein ABIB46_01155 [bacterium]
MGLGGSKNPISSILSLPGQIATDIQYFIYIGFAVVILIAVGIFIYLIKAKGSLVSLSPGSPLPISL